MFSLLGFFVQTIGLLLAVAFYTLLERKVLGYIQLRKGPNKPSFGGIPQPLADAVKLFAKEQVRPFVSNLFVFMFAPVLSLCLSLCLWVVYPSSGFYVYCFCFGVLFFLCASRIGVYGTLLAGWSSNSKYALLGSLRAVAQTISYEISMVLILLSSVCLVGSYNVYFFLKFQFFGCWVIFCCFFLGLVWFVTTLAETNRAPFDFAEGESEIVSGFNIEYSAGSFALIFMAEYGRILSMRLLRSLVFFGGDSLFFCLNGLFLTKTFFLSFVFLWVRGSLPRIRYDKLISLTWKSFLPVSLGWLIFILTFFIFYERWLRFKVVDCSSAYGFVLSFDSNSGHGPGF